WISPRFAAVVSQRGAEQERKLAVQAQLEAVEEARAATEQSVGLLAGQGDMARFVEDGEAVGVVEQQAAAARCQRRGEQIVVVADANALRCHGPVLFGAGRGPATAATVRSSYRSGWRAAPDGSTPRGGVRGGGAFAGWAPFGAAPRSEDRFVHGRVIARHRARLEAAFVVGTAR